MVRLKDVATVAMGVTFRSRIERVLAGDVKVIQMKDLDNNDCVNLFDTSRVDYPNLKTRHLAQSGDIIFRSRGQAFRAALLNEETANTIISAPLFRIRPNPNYVIPEYLLWWINQPVSQTYFSTVSKGTSVKMISKEGLENLQVKLLPLMKQRLIVQYTHLVADENRLMEQIKKHRNLLVHGMIPLIFKGSKNIEKDQNHDK